MEQPNSTKLERSRARPSNCEVEVEGVATQGTGEEGDPKEDAESCFGPEGEETQTKGTSAKMGQSGAENNPSPSLSK